MSGGINPSLLGRSQMGSDQVQNEIHAIDSILKALSTDGYSMASMGKLSELTVEGDISVSGCRIYIYGTHNVVGTYMYAVIPATKQTVHQKTNPTCTCTHTIHIYMYVSFCGCNTCALFLSHKRLPMK